MSHRRTLALGTSLFFVLASAGCGPSSPTLPASPDGTVSTVFKNVAEGKPEFLWAALPASYQKDIQDDVVRAFAAKMDPEMYGKGVTVVKKLTTILREKKAFILPQIVENPMFQMAQVDKAKFEQKWDDVIGLFDTVLASEFGDLKRLQSADVGSFLRVTGGKLMQKASEFSALSGQDPYKKEVQAKLRDTKVEVLKSEGDTATLKVSVPGERDEDTVMVRVEGKWIPKEMADGWKDGMAQMKKQIAAIDEKAMAAAKPKVMGMMVGVETALDQLAKTKTAEEFAQAVGGLMSNLPFALPGMGSSGNDPSMSPRVMPEDIPVPDAPEEK
jgi:hypothetical protein